MEQGLLGNTIRQARLDNHMTQEELAELVQITPTHLKQTKRKNELNLLISSCTDNELKVLIAALQELAHQKNKTDAK